MPLSIFAINAVPEKCDNFRASQTNFRAYIHITQVQIRGKRNAKTDVFVATLISRPSETETGELSGMETDLTTTTYQAQRHNFLLLIIYKS
jgi:hypothetical protein